MRFALMLFALLAGALLPLQAAMNGAINRALERPGQVVMISLAGSLIATGAAGLLAGLLTGRFGLASAERLALVPWWAWPAGVCGAIFLLSQPVVVPRVGAALFMSLAIAGSLTASVLLDHFGALRLPEHAASPLRILGVVLVAIGVGLIARF